MSDELEQLAATPDSEAASNSAAEGNSEAVGQHDDDSSDANSQEQAAEDEEEIEVGDKKIALPKSLAAILKSERMMNGDYTQKTQAIAKEREVVAAERADVARQAKEHQSYVKEMASVVAIDEQLAQYNALDWASIIASDPVQAMQYQQQQKTLEYKRQEAETSLTQKREQIALDKQQGIAKQIQQAEAYIEREIKGVNPERMKALEQYAKAEGMDTPAFAKAIVKSPQIAKFMHKAELYDKLMSKQAPKTPPVAAAQPAIRVGSNATVQKDPSKMTDKEFATWRSSQIKNRK
jgi:hypothetical protein